MKKEIKIKYLVIFIFILLFLQFLPSRTSSQVVCLYYCGGCIWGQACDWPCESGDYCYYNLGGGSCGCQAIFQCQYTTRDWPKPTCGNYCSGNIWFTGGTPSCTYTSGWQCMNYTGTVCNPSVCCDPTCNPTTGCGLSPNDAKCPSDGWFDTGATRWVDFPPCKEKEQKEQRYRDYFCTSPPSCGCSYSLGTTNWVDTGNVRNKTDGTNDCGAGCQRCVSGTCQDYNPACAGTVASCYCQSDSCQTCPTSGCCDTTCSSYTCGLTPNSANCSGGQVCIKSGSVCSCTACRTSGQSCSVTTDCCDYYTSGSTCYYNRNCSASICSFSSCSLADSCTANTLTTGKACSASGCSAGTTYTCNSATHSNCQSVSCGGSTYYCTYDGSSWQWRTSKPAENCTDGEDNDCDGLPDGADPDCGAPPCSGTIALTLTPSTLAAGGSVTPSATGLSNCGGTIYFRQDTCSQTNASSTCLVSGSGCTGSAFTAPLTIGIYTYYSCFDKNGNGNFSDAGESDFKTLTVTSGCESECLARGSPLYSCRTIPTSFGTGTDGPITFSSDYTITSDKNYTDVTIDSGKTVTVNSGVTIRVQGTLTVNGTLSSNGKGGAGGAGGADGGGSYGGFGQAGSNGPGLNFGGTGGKGGGDVQRPGGNYAGGGSGGKGYSVAGSLGAAGGVGGSNSGGGGGGGGGSYMDGGAGGNGGGKLTIYAYHIVINAGGIINSNGFNGEGSSDDSCAGGGGGGGGNILINIGSGGLSNSGLIRVRGGTGGYGGNGGGGGGGGGYIKVTAPSAVTLGNIDVSGGTGGGSNTAGAGGENGQVGTTATAIDANLAGGCSATETSIGKDGCPGTYEQCCCSGCNETCTGYQLNDYNNDCLLNAGACGGGSTHYTGGECQVCPLNNSSCSTKYTAANQTISTCYVPENMWANEDFTVLHNLTILAGATLEAKKNLVLDGGTIQMNDNSRIVYHTGYKIEIKSGYILASATGVEIKEMP